MIKDLFLLSVFALIIFLAFWKVIAYKFKANALGVNLSLSQVLGQGFRKTLSVDILEAAALAKKENLKIEFNALEIHKLAGGNPYKVVKGIVDCKKKGTEITFMQATALDLIGREISVDEIY